MKICSWTESDTLKLCENFATTAQLTCANASIHDLGKNNPITKVSVLPNDGCDFLIRNFHSYVDVLIISKVSMIQDVKVMLKVFLYTKKKNEKIK